mmetsp:Transcript_116102/g.223972  ORF Transcript_116102/g.223972 Transcript_116102/m.223972 type:complete len:921 (+) Transcript_116102:98-2860(+)
MASVPQLLCLLCVLTASFGALYFALNSAYDDVCDYEGVVLSCTELKEHEPNLAQELYNFNNSWFRQAQSERNGSEIAKCREEVRGMQSLIAYDRTEAYRIIDKCMAEFQQCAYQNFKETTPPPSTTKGEVKCFDTATGVANQQGQARGMDKYVTCITNPEEIDCAICDLFCRTTNWVNEHPDYAALMGYQGVCTSKVCPWEPECSTTGGFFLSATCSVRGCSCPKTRCLGSTTTTVNETIANTTTLTTTSSVSTSTRTSTTLQSTTTLTTSTTSLARRLMQLPSIERNPSGLLEDGRDRRLNQHSGSDCSCKGYVDTVLVGRPFRTFFEDKQHLYLHPNNVTWQQGVIIEIDSDLSVNNFEIHDCRGYFSNKYKYFGPRQVNSNPAHPSAINARGNHPDLGCGYGGVFQVTCRPTGQAGQCYADVDISTCTPPSYTEALADCYKLYGDSFGAPYKPQYDDWLQIEEGNLSFPEPNESVNITKPPDPRKCCDVDVSSTCEMGRQFSGTDENGTWLPGKSYHRETGYFPMIECSQQAEAHKPCPMVQINHIRRAAASVLATYPMCESVCNLSSVRDELQQLCDKTLHPGRENVIQGSHQEKIQIMRNGRSNLQAWSAANSPHVPETKEVHDCIDDSGSRRYNSMGLPQYRSGFTKLRLHNACRLHGCKQHQCLRVTRRCDIPAMDTFPERQCSSGEDQGVYECVDKIGIMNLNLVSPGFAIAWFVISLCMCCGAGVAKVVQVVSDKRRLEEEQEREAALAARRREEARIQEQLYEKDENGQLVRRMSSSSGTSGRLALLDQVSDPENQLALGNSPNDNSPMSRMALAKHRARQQLLMEEQEEQRFKEVVTHPNAMPALTDGAATGNAMGFEEEHRVIFVRGQPVPLKSPKERRERNNQLTLDDLAESNSRWLQIPDRRYPVK